MLACVALAFLACDRPPDEPHEIATDLAGVDTCDPIYGRDCAADESADEDVGSNPAESSAGDVDVCAEAVESPAEGSTSGDDGSGASASIRIRSAGRVEVASIDRGVETWIVESLSGPSLLDVFEGRAGMVERGVEVEFVPLE